MLYKVTPRMSPNESKPTSQGTRIRRRRNSAIYDSEGNEVLITLICLKCRSMKPLAQFGLRKMPDGAVRNQPWCRDCRSASAPKSAIPKSAELVATSAASALTG